MGSIHQVSQATFARDVLQSNVPVLIDFYADWCVPCRILAGRLEQLATEFVGRVKIVKVNVDHDPKLADRYRVESLPTLAFLNGGKLFAKNEGVLSEAGLRKALNKVASTFPASGRQAS